MKAIAVGETRDFLAGSGPLSPCGRDCV